MNTNDFANAAGEFQGITEGLHLITPGVISQAKAAFSRPLTGNETQTQAAQMELNKLVKSIDELMFRYDQMQMAMGFPSQYGKYTGPDSTP